jgi:hypothetical protein
MFGSQYKDVVAGVIKKKSDSVAIKKIAGKWPEKTVVKEDDDEKILFDGPDISAHLKTNLPDEEQEDFESIRYN